MPWVAAAATVVGSVVSSSASRSAASRSADAAQRASEEQAYQAEMARQDLAPWRKTGELANNRLSRMLGLDGPASDFASEDPGYAFRLQEGQRSVDNSAAARGSTLSGGALKALQRYGQGMASQEFQNSYNRLSGVSGQGQAAAAGQAAQSMQFGAQQGANTMAGGNAMAAGTIGQGNAWSGALQSGVNQYQDNQMMKMFNKRGSTYNESRDGSAF
tara:strand:+ start:11036 stop:11683 length:648 start_codon:yes stop_codon:yes gene_type:complete